MKKYIATLLCLAVLAMGMSSFSVSAQTPFTVKPIVDYDNERIEITGTTPALYGQNISVIIYKPAVVINTMADVEDRNDPEMQFELSIVNLRKIANVVAERDGSFSASFNLSDLEGGYYVVSAAGDGYMAGESKDSELIYFENNIEIGNTISAINDADKDSIEAIIREKELLLGIDVAGDYDENSEIINSLFVSIKEDDYPDGYSRDEMYKIQDTFTTIDLLRSLYEVEGADALIEFLEENKDDLGLDITDSDYTERKAEVAQIFLNVVKNGKENSMYVPRSVLDTKKVFRQSMAIARMNVSTNKQMTAIVEAYADVLGIDIDEYKKNCRTYNATEVNKAFVEMNFPLPENVTESYDDRIEDLTPPPSGGGGGGTGGGGGGSFGGGSNKDDKKTNTTISGDILEEPVTVPEMTQKFADVSEEHWAYEAVQTLAEMEIIQGMGDGVFNPDDLVTREQFVKMLVVAGKFYDSTLTSDFNDVAKDRWSDSYIASAVAKGIVTGAGDGTFNPSANLTRQDAATMAYRLCNVKNMTLSKAEVPSFNDNDTISEYAQAAVATLSDSGIINGFPDGTFKAQSTLTRAQAAKIIFEILKK